MAKPQANMKRELEIEKKSYENIQYICEKYTWDVTEEIFEMFSKLPTTKMKRNKKNIQSSNEKNSSDCYKKIIYEKYR